MPNEHTAAALRHRAASNRDPILFTPLHRLELRTTVRQCAYGEIINQADARRILRDIEDDLDDGTLVHEPIDWIKTLRKADEVADRLALTKPCRSLELWHVATALEIRADVFLTFDKDQLNLAKAEGLRSITPA